MEAPNDDQQATIKTREVTIDVHMQGRYYKPWDPTDIFIVPRLRNEGALNNDETINL